MFLTLLYGGIVGLSLGLTGGGGSIFAVPLLVYGLELDFRSAVALSLAIVGLTSAYGAALQARLGHVLWGAGAVLGLGGILAAPLGAWIGTLMPQRLSLLFFACLMVVIGVRMLRRTNMGDTDVPLSWIRCQSRADGHPHFSFACAGKLFGAGAVSGVLSGIFGVGGGFLVVPALLVVACVSIERALATSLVGISLIAASGFIANASHLAPQHWILAGLFLAGSAVGMTIGVWAKTMVSPRVLSLVFGLSVLGVAAFVILRNLSLS